MRRSAVAAFGLRAALRVREWMRNAPFVRLLTIHDLAPHEHPAFAATLDHLRSRYPILDPAQFLSWLESGEPPRETAIVLTFDDAYASQAAIARDVLSPRGLRAFFFVPTGFVGLAEAQARDFVAERLFDRAIDAAAVPPHSRPMLWRDIAYLVAQGHTIGAHTRTHPRLTDCESATLEDEIGGARHDLERQLRVPVSVFAYPFGDVASINIAALKIIARHYRFCFSGVRGAMARAGSRLAITRDAIDPGMSSEVVVDVVRGVYEPVYGPARRRLTAMAQAASSQ